MRAIDGQRGAADVVRAPVPLRGRLGRLDAAEQGPRSDGALPFDRHESRDERASSRFPHAHLLSS
jgi:hypothetical protein